MFVDERDDYAEQRLVAYGFIKGRLIAVVFTFRSDVTRIISMRKANKREVIKYG